MRPKQSFVDLRKFLLQILCLCAFVAAYLPSYAAGQGDQGDWWMFHHDPQHTGLSSFNGPSTPALKWKYDIESANDAYYSSPAIGANGTIYVGSTDDNLYALNPADGSLKWKYATGNAISSSPAIGADGTIYVGSYDNNLYALNPDGSLKWKYITGAPILSSPAIGADGTIYVGSEDDNLYALNPKDGSLKWQYTTGSVINSSPAIGVDGTIYVGSKDRNLYALNPADGSLKWKYTTGSVIDFSSPAISADGTIYVGSYDNGLHALNPADGSQKWGFDTGDWIESSPAIGADGTIYIGSSNGVLFAINPADGSQKWYYATGNLIWSSPAIGADGMIYVGSEDDNLYALNPADGSLKWKYATGNAISSSPAIGADGTIYVGAWDGNLYAITQSLTCIITPIAGSNGTINPSTVQMVATGGSLTFTATPNNNYVVNTWIVDGEDVQIGGTTFTLSNITADHTIMVTFNYTGPNIPNQQGDWFMFHHDLQHTGRSPFNGPASPVQKWAYPTDDYSYGSSPSIAADGTIYVGSSDGNLYALNPDGTQKWAFPTALNDFSSPTIATDGTIYFGSGNASGSDTPLITAFYAINPDGTQKWVFSTDGFINACPAIGADGTIYIDSNDGNLYAINPDGTQQWMYSTGTWMNSSPAIGSDGTIYTGSGNGNLYAFNLDGSQKWAFPTGSWIQTSPAIGVDGTIYIGVDGNYDTGYNYSVGNLYAINPDGTQKWVLPVGGIYFSSPAIGADGTIYFGSLDNNIYAINPDGTEKWVFPTGNMIWSSPAIDAEGTIYVGSLDSNLYAINPNGTQKWVLPTGNSIASSPAIGADGTLYIGSEDGNFYAIGTATTSFTITPSAGANGSISPNNAQTVTSGGNLTFTASPNSNYAVNTWSVDGIEVQIGGTTYTLINITGDHSVTVTFNYIGPVGQGDWWMFHHDPQHTGRSAFSGPSNPALKWKYLAEGAFYSSSPAIGADGTIYVGSWDDNLYALNPADGSLKWQYATGNKIDSCPAIGTDGTIYIGSYDDNLYALNPADGSLKWQYATEGPILFSSPTIGADGTIYVGSDDSNLYALNPADGSLTWQFTTGDLIESSPAIGADGTIYIRSDDANLYALNSADGLLKWSSATGSVIPDYNVLHSSPAIGADGTIYVGSEDGNLYALNPADGSLKWKYTTEGTIDSSPAIGADGTIYVGSVDDNLYALNPADGSLKWKYATRYWIESSPGIGLDGTIYVGSDDESLYAFNPADGSLKWEYFTDTNQIRSSPAIGSDGTIYVGSNDGNLYAITQSTYTITPIAGANGTINPNTAQTMAYGSILTFTASPNTNYAVNAWFVDGNEAQTGGTTYTFTNTYNSPITANHTVKVTFNYIGPNEQGDWFMFHHDLQHTGRSPFNGPGSPVQKWAFPTGDNTCGSSPSIGADGTIYVGSSDGNLYALNPDGTQLWAFPTGVNYFSSPTIGIDGTIYLGSGNGAFYAINPDGTQKWVFSTGGFINASPAIGADGTIYIDSNDGNFYAINPDGTQQWMYSTGTWMNASPAIGSDGTIYTGSGNGYLYAFTPDGTLKWEINTGGWQSTPAIGADGTIYTGSADGNLHAINPDGTPKWACPTGYNYFSCPAIGSDGTIYEGTCDNNLYAINPDGTQQWVFPTGNMIWSSPAIDAEGTIYVGSLDSNLYAINPNGTQKWALPTGNCIASSPAIGTDGTLYVGSEDNNFYAIGTATTSIIITPIAGANGSISPNTAQTVTSGGNLTFTAMPNSGYGVNVWTLDGATVQSGGTSYTLNNITANHSVGVTFSLLTFTVTTTTDGNGQISPSEPAPVNYGSSLTFTSTPNTGYAVNVWTLDGAAVQTGGTSYSLSNITANHSVGVTFSLLTFIVTANAGANGQVTPTAPPTVNYGNSLTFTATPNSGYLVNTWSVDGTVAQTGGTTFTLTNITANHTVQVFFFTFTFTATPASPQLVNTPITLAVVTTGSATGEFEFRAGYLGSNGTQWSYLTGYTSATSCTWTPTLAGAYTLIVYARAVGNTDSFDAYQTLTYQVNNPPVSAVTLSASPPSPAVVNTPITLTAVASGGNTPQYEFRMYYTDAAGTHWSTLSAYASATSCTWTPTTTGTFTLVVYARSGGNTDSFDAYTTLNYQVNNPPVTKVTLNTNPASPAVVKTPITLTAVASGGVQPQYEFRLYYTTAAGLQTVYLTGYTASATCTWIPTTANTYTLVVYARSNGNTNSYDAYNSLTFQVTNPPVPAVTLSASPATPAVVNTHITLTAVATAITQPQYQFRAYYTNAAGSQVTEYLTGYTNSASYTWTPTTAATYLLVVYARATGHTNSFDTYTTLNYQVNNPPPPPITAVTLSTSPASPALVNSPITLTAVATGGSQPQYEFRAYYTNAAGAQTDYLTGYTNSLSYTWTPTATGTYTLVVYARSSGRIDSFDVYTTLNFVVTNIPAPPVTAVTLSASPASPAQVNTPITLTAVATGGSQPQYEFRLYYTNAAGTQTDYLTGYTASASYTWTPATAGTYTLVVYARSGGNTNSFDVYTTVSYVITQ